MVMKALGIVFTGKNQLERRTLDVADPGPGQVLVRATASLISTGTECICLQRNFAPGTNWEKWVHYPFYPGYSMVGRVLKTAPDVDNLKPGDRVLCEASHAQYVLSSARHAVPIPDSVSDEEATWGKLAYITQHGFRRGQVKLGEVVVIVGAGLLGQLVTQYAALSGAAEVIVIDTVPGRLAMAAAHGATHTLCKPIEQAETDLKTITGKAMADVVFDVTGHWSVLPHALGLLRRFGRLVIVGDTGEPEKQHLIHNVLGRDLTIMGAHDVNTPMDTTDFAPWSQGQMTSLFYRYLGQGRMRVRDLMTHTFSPHDAAQAYELLTQRRSEAMGVIFNWRNLQDPGSVSPGDGAGV
ncbi:MAG: zinc-binding alcohol dehydrogenase [Phycisphaeraceae bacterium]|nr:zinc-binding alcohol dehydrogenase [Phycisphaeraceae bacterium]